MEGTLWKGLYAVVKGEFAKKTYQKYGHGISLNHYVFIRYREGGRECIITF